MFKDFVKESYKKDWPTMVNNLTSNGLSIFSASVASGICDNLEYSTETTTGIATLVDFAAFWGTFIPQLMYRDKEYLKDEKGNYSKNKIKAKAREYGSMFTLLEGTYLIARPLIQYYLDKKGLDPALASAVSQAGIITIYTALLPIIRTGIKKLSNKNLDDLVNGEEK
ncbi:hypothetical protein J4216_02600 [Candidatus Woesearchaeota archaeon]|nr:hypothetical protein [Candidatus Woesearchaeota archaeon]